MHVQTLFLLEFVTFIKDREVGHFSVFLRSLCPHFSLAIQSLML
jgi:hypothetical protein